MREQGGRIGCSQILAGVWGRNVRIFDSDKQVRVTMVSTQTDLAPRVALSHMASAMQPSNDEAAVTVSLQTAGSIDKGIL